VPGPLTTLPLGADLGAFLARLPAGAGVVQLLDGDGRSLVVGRPAGIRRWAARQLGQGPPPRPGRRPPVDLRPVAKAARFVRTDTSFEQRLAYERLLAPLVPLAARRDVKPAAWLELDLGERFPRLTLRDRGVARYGPFAGRRAAEAAREALQKRLGLRPCDYRFEPHPELPLGLGCLHAQLRTCVAPCLVRIDVPGYAALAAQASDWLARPSARRGAEAEALPAWVAPAAGHRAVAAEPLGEQLLLVPVFEGAVLEAQARRVSRDALASALDGLTWASAEPKRDEWPWLLAWLGSRPRGALLALGAGEAPVALAPALAALRGAAPRRSRRPTGGDTLDPRPEAP
jgi:hypothetical protein